MINTQHRYPYLLPSLVCVCVNMVTCIMIAAFMVETRPGGVAAYQARADGGGSGQQYDTLSTESSHPTASSTSTGDADMDVDVEEGERDGGTISLSTFSDSEFDNNVSTTAISTSKTSKKDKGKGKGKGKEKEQEIDTRPLLKRPVVLYVNM